MIVDGLLSKSGSYGRETLTIGKRQFEDETEAVGNPAEEVIYVDRDESWDLEVVDLGRDATGIVAGVEPYDAAVLEALPDLRCVSRCGVGVDNVDLEAAVRLGILVRNTPDVVTHPAAELTVALIMDLAKNVTLHSRLIHGGRWKKKVCSLLSTKRVGVLDLGRIGRRVAELLRGLGVDVQGTDLDPDRAWAAAHGVSLVAEGELLASGDFVSLHVADVLGKRFIMDESRFASMKPGARFINVARGHFVDEEALLGALESGHLAGAGLDVFREEPYGGPLAGREDVVLTPHVATLTRESRAQMEYEAVENLLESLAASP